MDTKTVMDAAKTVSEDVEATKFDLVETETFVLKHKTFTAIVVGLIAGAVTLIVHAL